MRRSIALMFFAACSMSFVASSDAQTSSTTESAGLAVTNEQLEEAKLLALKAVSEMDLNQIIEELSETWTQYERQLQAVLKTRLVEEREFIGRLVLLVQQEQIPKGVIDAAWLWVRKNRSGTPYPFVYFERVLRLEAEKTKVLLPAFDREIYGDRNAMRQRLQQQRLQRLRR